MGSRTSAVTLFCEDVRLELNGKLSLMGVLRQALWVAQSPQLLPKLVAVAFVDMPNPPPAKVMDVWLTNNEQPFLPRAHIPLSSEPGGTLTPINQGCTITVPIEIVPLEATDGMNLQMHVRLGDFECHGDTLAVIHASSLPVT